MYIGVVFRLTEHNRAIMCVIYVPNNTVITGCKTKNKTASQLALPANFPVKRMSCVEVFVI